MHVTRCGGPRLKKFAGRPQDYSPKARLLNFLGYKLPFDRHDWVVDRCGKEVRCNSKLLLLESCHNNHQHIWAFRVALYALLPLHLVSTSCLQILATCCKGSPI